MRRHALAIGVLLSAGFAALFFPLTILHAQEPDTLRSVVNDSLVRSREGVSDPATLLDDIGGSDYDADELFDQYEIQQLDDDSLHRVTIRSRVSLPADAHTEQGYLSRAFQGSPLAFDTHITATSRDWKLGAVQDKQSWEADLFDRAGLFLELRHPIQLGGGLSIQRCILGDQALSIASGLLFGGGGPAVSRTVDPVAGSMVEPFGARGTFSSLSGRSLRGGLAELGVATPVGLASLELFGAKDRLDAAITEDTLRTIYTTDLHRTSAELATMADASVALEGARVMLSTTGPLRYSGLLGATAYGLQYDPSRPTGRSTHGYGIDLDIHDTIASLTGEVARSIADSAGVTAIDVALRIRLSHQLGFAVNYRHVPVGYVAPYALVGGRTVASLENADGYYLAGDVTLIEHTLWVAAYVELDPKLASATGVFPSRKHDEFVSVTFSPASETRLVASVRDLASEGVQTSSVGGLSSMNAFISDRRSVRLQLTRAIGRAVHSKTRFEFTSVTGDTAAQQSRGFMLMEALAMEITPWSATLEFTATRFGGASSASAPYLFERSVDGGGAILLLGGYGWRCSANLRASLFSRVGLSLATFASFYDHTRMLGSGLTSRQGATDAGLAAQLRLEL